MAAVGRAFGKVWNVGKSVLKGVKDSGTDLYEIGRDVYDLLTNVPQPVPHPPRAPLPVPPQLEDQDDMFILPPPPPTATAPRAPPLYPSTASNLLAEERERLVRTYLHVFVVERNFPQTEEERTRAYLRILQDILYGH